MAQEEDDPPLEARRRRWPIALAVAAGILALALAFAWFARERIAGSLIAGQLRTFGLPATYEIESIGPRRQVLRKVVIGDPKQPDMTIARVEIDLVTRFDGPAIDAVRLEQPRLYGSYRAGKFSFGSLDKLLFGGDSKQPFRLPDMMLAVIDGRGLLESDYGPVGLKLDGQGGLRGGFAGTLAAIAPRIAVQGCRADRATLYGRIRVAGERPHFTGPLRLDRLDCPASRLRLAKAALQVDATADKALDGAEGKLGLRSDELALGDNRVLGSEGSVGFTWRKQALTARYDLTGRELATPQAAAVAVRLAGVARRSGSRIEVEGNLEGSDVALGAGLDTALGQAQRSAEGTLAAPLLGQIRAALRREGQGSLLAVSYILRQAGAATNLVVPQASLRGGSGATLLSLSRFQLTADGKPAPRLSGNFATGGAGLPQIAGRLERQPGGRLVTRMALAEYRAGDGARIALPKLTLVQLANGALGFAGEARLSGALPGGRTENLVLPLEGNWAPARGFAAWRQCTTLRFDRLALANLAFERRALTLCPPSGEAIVVSDARGLRVAAGAPSLDLAGRLGATPIRIRSGPIGLAWPGTLAAKALDIELGPPATASRFRVANLDARIGSDVAGSFAGSDVRLAAVPLDILDAGGTWRYAGEKLTLNGAFRLEDREIDDRFQPLIAQDGELQLVNNVITAAATLREPASAREVVRTTIRHDLNAGRGHADLAVAGLVFDDRVQPDTLTRLALGVIANAQGKVAGSGRIDWTPDRVTSSGRFSTDSLDFAAAFGPVKGASGTIVFTDLLGMVSAPDQQLRIAAINPGIEVNDGVLTYELRPDSVLAVKGAAWPFLDGSLTLLPVTMRMGVAEVRRYTLMIEGLNAARFVERMQVANLAATGTFDGTLPLVFDENGGRIDGGFLKSRPPGGNVSYVGALTYKDLSTMANFAFYALKSMDYRDMEIGMNGPLEGEIVTRVQFAGIRQGSTAKRNFLTERIAKLPIRFNVNLRAPFFQLVSSFRSLYDPAYVRDPRTLGLIDAQGRPIALPKPAGAKPVTIQPPESGKLP